MPREYDRGGRGGRVTAQRCPLRALGLDLSLTSSGLVVVDLTPEGEYRVRAWRNPTSTADWLHPERWEQVRKKCAYLYRKWKPDIVVMEGGARGGRFVDLNIYRLAGVVEHDLWKKEAPFAVCTPTQLQKWVTGVGKKNKPLMLEMARAFWPECPNHDCADGAHLACWGLFHYDTLVQPSA